jgi:MSHA biogenesis protein MshJ
VLACFLAVVDAVWLSPVATVTKKLAAQLTTQEAELARLRAELVTASQPVDVTKQVREEIAKADVTLEMLNADIEILLPKSKNGPVLEDVLVQFLRKHEGLTLMGLNTLASQPAANAAPVPIAKTGAATALAELSRKGLELKVKGPYAQLIAYVQKLETALPYLRWGGMQLKSEAQPPELTLQVYVLGVNTL